MSNGVQAFRDPVVPEARRTLTAIIAILILLLAGIAVLVPFYGISATVPGAAGYQSVLSMVTAAVVGTGPFYDLTMLSVLLVLCLSANTSFADFPRLCHMVALDNFLPHSLTLRGRRLVYSQGIWALAVMAGLLLVIFGGVTDRLIPLFAVGAFLAFTLSQLGMVSHWWRQRGTMAGARTALAINALGAVATGVTVIVVIVAKFTEGAWVVVVLLPAAVFFMARVQRHYRRVLLETTARELVVRAGQEPPIVIVPIDRWNAATEKALRFAMSISPDVEAVHIACDEDDSVAAEWRRVVEDPARAAGVVVPRLVTLTSPLRFVLRPIVDYVLEVEKKHRHRTVAVAIAVMVEHHWYHYFLHNQRAEALTAMLLLGGDRRIHIINVPWYLTA